MKLPQALYDSEQTRQLDDIAITQAGIPGSTLMCRAGAATLALLQRHYPRARTIAIVCGVGNNGGDGYVVARLAQQAGLTPLVLELGDPERRRGEARRARADMQVAGVACHPFQASRLDDADLIVDAVFGTGLQRDASDDWLSAIDAINAAAAAVLAVDIPSGLHADSGRVLGSAVDAALTITFIGLKAGLLTGEGPAHCGHLIFDDLGVPTDIYAAVSPCAHRITERSLIPMMSRRRRTNHKGDFGHVVVVGGAEGMRGAVRLAGEAALRTGAGLVTVATHPAHAAYIGSSQPELMSCALHDAKQLRAPIERATVIAVGPGLGREQWGRKMLAVALESKRPLVVDADGLNLLAADPMQRGDWVLTPHPGEAARLLNCTRADVQAQRFDAVRSLAQRFGGIVVLKGAGTLIAESGSRDVWLCDAGNPGMASGGMGDLLTGIIAALMAQGLPGSQAARLGVWLHATAADDAARASGEIGLLASDLLPLVRTKLNRLSVHEV